MEAQIMLNVVESTAIVLGTLVLVLFIGLWLPGVERKYIHARIQQRIGPPVSSSGLMSFFKFLYKKTIIPNSPAPELYNALPLFGIFAIACIYLFLIPQMYSAGAFATLILVVGLLKVEEVIYIFMGSLSRSIMSLNLPFPDVVNGAKHTTVPRSFLEDLSAKREFKLIAFGSFPLYISLFIPAILTGSLYIGDIVLYQQFNGPNILTFSGAVGAVVYFFGFMMLMNEYPFSILKGKSDVIEGPYMEYAAKYRAYVYLSRGLLIFTLASLFSVLFIGITPNLLSLGFLINIVVALIFAVLMAIFSAFAPMFTFKQYYPVVIVISLIGIFALISAFTLG